MADGIVKAMLLSPNDDPTLADGASGRALVYAYHAAARSPRLERDTAARELDRAIEAVGSTLMPPSLYGGFLGVAWTAQLLQDAVSDPAGDLNADIDEALLTLVAASPWEGHYDLVSGLVGFGVYALERLPGQAAAAALEGIVDRLVELAERRADGVTWHTPARLLPSLAAESHPAGLYDLGIAHGVPGVIAFLGNVCAARIATARARPLLDAAVSWVLARQAPEAMEAAFGSCADSSNRVEPTRTAWCYGDPGVAAALLLAADAVAEPSWRDAALSVARRATRRPRSHTGVSDSCFCHGAAGLGHLYNRLFQRTGEQDLAVEARFWIERTLLLSTNNRGDFGPMEIDRLGAADTGILTGAGGVALALLAAASAVDPRWDRAFLLSTLAR